ncbi:MAG: YdbH domain-containing protein, partial [Bdellovibrionaceae bacterium]|nr:YdbH domain-containing protein [Pseudobdellovibrionaceae bacterium]
AVQKIFLELSTPSDWATLLEGTLHLNNITYTPPPTAPKKGVSKNAHKVNSAKPLFSKVNSKIRFQKLGETIKAFIDISDATKNLAIRNLELEHTPQATKALFKKATTQIHLNSQITELLPITKEHIKTISGVLSAEGHVQFKDDNLTGGLKLFGKDISVSSGYGDVTEMQWEHDVLSFKTFTSSPLQTLRIKSFTAGKTIENIYLEYQVMNLDTLRAQKLHLEYEKALIDAENFMIHPLKQELIGFKATIKNLPLESILTMALGPFVSATGHLNGHVNLEFEDKIPTMNGRLTSEKEGWILYRKQGDQQQNGLQLSDSPMTILNSYLYNFNYKTLDLDLRSNKQYQMNVLLGAYGHNPDYLKGKPLKLKINLEQNVLAAIQSMMLSYDLPSKLKERIEDNQEE